MNPVPVKYVRMCMCVCVCVCVRFCNYSIYICSKTYTYLRFKVSHYLMQTLLVFSNKVQYVYSHDSGNGTSKTSNESFLIQLNLVTFTFSTGKVQINSSPQESYTRRQELGQPTTRMSICRTEFCTGGLSFQAYNLLTSLKISESRFTAQSPFRRNLARCIYALEKQLIVAELKPGEKITPNH